MHVNISGKEDTILGCNTILNELKTKDGREYIAKKAVEKENEEFMSELKGILSKPFDQIKDRIILRFASASDDLEKRPHKIIHKDYSVIFQIILNQTEDSIVTAAVPHLFFIIYPFVTVDMMYEIALENTKRVFPHAIIKCIDPITGGDFLCALTNRKTINGAISILYDEALEELSEILSGSYWLLPASVNEWIAAPKHLHYLNLKSTVTGMNQILDKKQVLGTEPLFYDAESKHIVCGANVQKTKKKGE